MYMNCANKITSAVTVLYFENLKSLLATRINYKWQTLILQKLLISEKADITLACFDKYQIN